MFPFLARLVPAPPGGLGGESPPGKAIGRPPGGSGGREPPRKAKPLNFVTPGGRWPVSKGILYCGFRKDCPARSWPD